jgi:parvulin-like peptidyl-prolyl isomerase
MNRRTRPLLLVPLLAANIVPGFSQETKGPASPEQSHSKKEKLPQGVLARVNERDITINEYSGYLLELFGKAKLWNLIDRVLVEQQAERRGVHVSAEDVGKLVDDKVEQVIRVLHNGDRAGFVESIQRRQGMNLEEYKEFLRQKKAYELLLERTILRDRVATEEELKREFEDLYGEGGVRYELRHILVRTGSTRTGRQGQTPLSDAEARKKAEKVLEEIQGGADFIDSVKKYSEDRLTRQNDGRIPVYRRRQFGPDFHGAVEQLSNDKRISGVVKSRYGYHVIFFIDKKVTEFKEKREEIEQRLKTKRPSQVEKQEFLRNLREKARIQT